MAERDGDRTENDGIEQAALAALPEVKSPPLSPAGASSDEPAEADASVEAADEIEAAGDENSGTAEPAKDEGAAVSALTASRRWLKLSRRQQHRLTLAAWVMLVAGLGALFGGAISNGLAVRDRTEVASLAQSKAMQQSIDRLTKQVGELKTKLAAATAHSRDRQERGACAQRRHHRLHSFFLGAPRVGSAAAPGAAAHRGRGQPAGGGA